MNIACYITGHGFGHATRTLQVLRHIQKLHTGTRFLIKTTVPEWLVKEAGPADSTYILQDNGPGITQVDALSFDPAQTLRACMDFLDRKEDILHSEVSFLKASLVDVVISDIPAFPFAAAARVGIPGYGIANFSWDWIYEEFLSTHKAFRCVINDLQTDYKQCTRLFKLPFSARMAIFPQQHQTPLVCRQSALQPSQIRQRFGLSTERPVALLSFGGISLQHTDWGQIGKNLNVQILCSEIANHASQTLIQINRHSLQDAGLGYHDLVKAADVCITKPGYGIVAECLANHTRMIFTDRGNFREYGYLQPAILEHLSGIFVSNEEVIRGKVNSALEASLSKPLPPLPFPANGAEVIAQYIVSQN